MTETTVTAQANLLAEQLPILPETHLIEPIVQCGVLYLGTAPPSAGLHGLAAIQEPFSHRYPVDGTNTVRGIDAVLSVYDNGLQIAFTRQPHVAMFLPINSLNYCASVRFSIVENEQNKPASLVDWRFMPLDAVALTKNNTNKHPPLFCAIIQRTQILPGDECHCFVTKSTDAALSLVRGISQVYTELKPSLAKGIKAPVFYQLDRFGRKISETTGVIYLSPADDDDAQLNRTIPNRLTDESITRDYLFDPSYNGYFYRTDASLVEQWQLWDDDDEFNGYRPRPPASPFGLHEGLYHDDTTEEIQRHLYHMDDEEHSRSCSCSSENSSSISSISTKHSPRPHRRHSTKIKLTDDEPDQFHMLLSTLQPSSFEPISTSQHSQAKSARKKPIIIEKILPKLNTLPSPPESLKHSEMSYIPSIERSSFSYHVNKYGEKITKEGNRIVFIDAVQMNGENSEIYPKPSRRLKARSRSRRYRSSKKVPVIDIQAIEQLFDEKKSISERRTSVSTDNQPPTDRPNSINHMTTSAMLQLIDGYFEDFFGHTRLSPNQEDQSIHEQSELSRKKDQQQQTMSSVSSTNISRSEARRRYNHSTITSGSLVNYAERPFVPSIPSNQASPIPQRPSPVLPPLTNEKISEYVSNIYGLSGSIKSSTSSIQQPTVHNPAAVTNPGYISAYHYMHSSINPNILRAYRNGY